MSQTTPFIEYANIGDVKVTAKYDLESYQQGKTDGAKDFAEWLATKRGFSKEWVKWHIDHWQKGAEE